MRLALSLALLGTTFLTTSTVFAADLSTSDECNGPCLIYEGTADLSAAWLLPSDSAIGNSYLLLPKTETNVKFKANDAFSVMANIVSEQVIDPDPGRNQLFSGLGTYVDVLQAQYDLENFSIWGGKIHPAFGRAWDVTPGLHGTDLAESYELAERLGGGISYDFEAAGLSNRLQVSASTVDRTILSQSLFNDRGRANLDDGGAGNSKGVSTVAIALDGCLGAEVDSCYDDGSFGYQLAARFQKGGSGSDGNELGFLGSLNKTFALGDETSLRLLGEAAWFRNFDGTTDDALALTGSAALEAGAMTYSLAYSQLRTLVSGGRDTVEHLVDVTAMYDFGDTVSMAGEKWSIGAGYSLDAADGENVQTIGLKLETQFGSSVSLGK